MAKLKRSMLVHPRRLLKNVNISGVQNIYDKRPLNNARKTELQRQEWEVMSYKIIEVHFLFY